MLLKPLLKPTAQQKLHVCPGFASQMEEGGHGNGGAEVLVLFDVVPLTILICYISKVLGTLPA